jgi:iron transport multicopper oxidase
LLLEEAPPRHIAKSVDRRSAQVVVLSAKSFSSLKMNKQKLLLYLERNPETSLADLSYTTTCRRAHHRIRFATGASTLSELKDALSKPEDSAPNSKAKIAFAFTGQGTIFSGVGKELFAESRQFRSDILQFNNLAQAQGLPSFLPLFDAATDIKSLSPVQTQLGQVCIQMALYRLWVSWGITPDSVIGHSLGEYGALYASGVLSASDTILLVGRRAEHLQQYCTAGTHAMLAVKGSMQMIQDFILHTETEIACVNGINDVVLSGRVEEIKAAAELLARKGFKSTILDLQYAFHSSQMDSILKPFEKVAQSAEFRVPKVPLLSPLLGVTVQQGEVISASYLSRHLREKVDFVAALESRKATLTSKDCLFVEIGPHPLCSGMIKTTLGVATVPTLRRREDSWETVSRSLSALYSRGIDVDWAEYHRDFALAHQLLALPSYAFDEKNYWLEYKNDWALEKSDATTPTREVPVVTKTGPATSSVQRLIQEDIQDQSASAEFESDLDEQTLRDSIIGHVINGIGLCPSVSAFPLFLY